MTEFQSAFAEVLNDTPASSPFAKGDWIVDQAIKLLREHGCQYRYEIIDAAKFAYDNYVAPWDIPGVPNFVEPIVDEKLGEILVTALYAVADAICGPDITGDPV